MNADQIEGALEREMGENMFLGCFARDELPEFVPRPSCLIANTDLAGDGGKHWVAFYFTDDDKGEFFCSYGSPPFEYEEFYKLLNTTYDFIWFDRRLQSNKSYSCGQYCVYYLVNRYHGRSDDEIMEDFTDDLDLNDCLVADWMNEHYDMNTLCHPPWETQSCEARSL
jgi:hypothetical protein